MSRYLGTQNMRHAVRKRAEEMCEALVSLEGATGLAIEDAEKCARAEGKAEGFAEGVSKAAEVADDLEATGMRGTSIVDVAFHIRALVPKAEAPCGKCGRMTDKLDMPNGWCTPCCFPEQTVEATVSEPTPLDDMRARLDALNSKSPAEVVAFAESLQKDNYGGFNLDELEAMLVTAPNAAELAALNAAAPELIRRARAWERRDANVFTAKVDIYEKALAAARAERDEAHATIDRLRSAKLDTLNEVQAERDEWKRAAQQAERERDEARRQLRATQKHHDGAAELAESRAANAAGLAQQLAAARAERDEARQLAEDRQGAIDSLVRQFNAMKAERDDWKGRFEKAASDRGRLENTVLELAEALRSIAHKGYDPSGWSREVARAALAKVTT